MQEENKTVDIDTSGPGADIELENDSKETENELEVKMKLMKTIMNPMIHLRNLVSSLIFRLANKKKKQKKMS